jgi:iron complex outermembrane receptor protein
MLKACGWRMADGGWSSDETGFCSGSINNSEKRPIKKRHEKFLRLFVSAGLLLLLLPLLAHAQPELSPSAAPPAEEMILFQEIPSVYGASKYEQKVTEAPSSISIVTAAEIRKYGYRTLADILRSIRGFFVTYDRNYNYIGVRGFNRPADYNTRVLLLVDGHRINDNIYDTAFIGTEFPVDVDLIERVEIIRGPSSSIYGANAFFGVINVVTKRGRDLKGAEASGEAGSFHAYKGRLSYGNKLRNGLEMLFSGSYSSTRGKQRLFFKEFADPATNFGVAEGSDDDWYYSYFTKLSFHDFTLLGAYGYRKKTIPTASFGADFNNPHNWTIDARGYLDLKYEHSFENQWNVLARLYYDDYYYHGDYIFSSVKNKDFAWGKWWGGEFKITKALLDRHKIVFGTEINDNFRQDQRNYDELPFTVFLDDKRDSFNWALYLQDEFSVLENLVLNAGVRYDHYETFGATTNPRIALIYSPLEKTIFKLLYGRAFRPPNVFELRYSDGNQTGKSNPNLEPETIHTYELVYEQYLGRHLRGTSTLFYHRIRDLISQTIDPADGLLVFQNLGQAEAIGFEAELEGKWTSGWEGRISYSYVQTKDKDTKETLTNSPAHLAKLNLILPLVRESFFINPELQYTSRRKTLARSHSDDFLIANLTVFSQNLIKGLEISGSVYNLFDKKYGDPGAGEHIQDVIRQDGRTYRLKLTYAF